jgi:hypothetical protein
MANKLEVRVLLVDKDSGAQIGFIRFDPSGLLVYQTMMAGMHVFAFKSIDRILNEQWIKEPLYKKHASLLDENKKLPEGVLEQEASACADFLNSLASPPVLGSHAVKAQMTHAPS